MLTAVFQAAEESHGPFQCDLTCQHIIDIAMFSIIATSFVIPIISMIFVLVTLHCHKNRAESIGSFSSDSSTFHSARTRLAWTLFTFTLISLSEAIPSSYMTGLKIDSDMTQCVNFYQADHLIYPAIMSSIQTLSWFVPLLFLFSSVKKSRECPSNWNMSLMSPAHRSNVECPILVTTSECPILVTTSECPILVPPIVTCVPKCFLNPNSI
uniref:G_PROTEIN_RECEP_F1_2 domain-containing protein n=1 Tax=Caenorhabditis tropicalis TaxID=1561998 RepID=A0A1I7T0I3_9PELO